MKTLQLVEKIATAPDKPGCYLYKDKDGQIIYVGKAKAINKRVKSYFARDNLDPFVRKLVKNIRDVEFVVTDSELEALLLEHNLIKKYAPKFNRDLKDDKNYIWLKFSKNQDFPKPEIVREKKERNAVYLGPYPSTMPIRRIMATLRKIYNYRTCNRKIEEIMDEAGNKIIKSSNTKPCLYYHLNLCSAPCAGYISKPDYNRNITSIKRFFGNEKHELIKELSAQMTQFAKAREYETAAKYRDQINDLNYVSQRVHIDSDFDEKKYLQEKKKKQELAVQELIDKLEPLKFDYNNNFKIECYDISNIQGTNAVGSMVVFVNGKQRRDLYRKFKIKTKTTPDDFAMLQEVLTRRFKRTDKETDESFSIFPDLIIIDGGKGQLSSVFKILIKQKIQVPVVGLAKKLEEIFIINDTDGELKFLKRTLTNKSEALFLIQRIRDESHRFALNYHRKLRSTHQLKSSLDDIPGIGKTTKIKLLKAFGSIDGIKKASDKDLAAIIKNSKTKTTLKKILESI